MRFLLALPGERLPEIIEQPAGDLSQGLQHDRLRPPPVIHGMRDNLTAVPMHAKQGLALLPSKLFLAA